MDLQKGDIIKKKDTGKIWHVRNKWRRANSEDEEEIMPAARPLLVSLTDKTHTEYVYWREEDIEGSFEHTGVNCDRKPVQALSEITKDWNIKE